MNLKDLENKIKIKFKNLNLLKEAVTHRSYLNENPHWPLPNNERLEFLGDAVLELIVTEYLFSRFPKYVEGQLTSLRAALVNYQMLSQVAKNNSLENYILLSKGEAKDTARAKEVILADTFEALIGAIYLDQGYEETKDFIKRSVLSNLKEVIEQNLYSDPKSRLQEIVQEQLKVTPTYKVLKEFGPDHQKTFLIGVFYNEKLIAEGEGLSKQEAECQAAEKALKGMEE
ncbi:ribonuclease III [Candidatus Jorgensenbacteria bacterium CG_4_10_14_0_8_um_filter_39_13]|uniref:Ribonuclease 3 n=2 Tax=Candidatus Joergenseniibacteriota TaxID=1752739 RepID=A0A2M7RIF7_9BACT|nr:MAG: ribonuclease III [Candidatus Jorgensenbacteria bacterium CG11_big_fil_rev_8_21_14_0_20_38_23]PIV13437.1 MAG: ribonuclease III [Candidatus Jorgensenbacteria bacterium CG03_land_8_20_14_0_80_38_39]PIW97431.1 MAG: ribonuclease III [Candidatus Jorgensenbacteria bacterium CG_4_8_14_3_um_filter_38_10]PIY96484.1 MAG: ribonuclease III [Candidatus Jorgensenbacteria bacterium CG_4_10_14_0_8_um_filter_39_13]PJA95187.1 MAG: ribonuclease III [Candidatus Jorgensenbacteria bacterium CG_4_9_14_3_um_fil